MTTPIENAREKVAQALATLPAKGIRNDNILILKRLPVEDQSSELSMYRSAKPDGVADLELEIIAPKVKIFSGFGFLANAQTEGSGVIRAGDHVLEFPRTAAVEAFLALRNAYPDRDNGGLYPEMELVIFELDGKACRAVRWLPGTISLRVWVRAVNGA